MAPDPKYGYQHQRARAAWAQRIANGAKPPCSRCGYPVLPTDTWHLDHQDDGVTYRGPAHADCNMSAGGKRAQKLRRRRKSPESRRASREW